MDKGLRNSLWNFSCENYFKSFSNLENTGISKQARDSAYRAECRLIRDIFGQFLKLPIDSFEGHYRRAFKKIRESFFELSWNEVYDFFEFIFSMRSQSSYEQERLNKILERESSGYRFVAGQFVDIVNQLELDALEEAIEDDTFSGVSAHFKRALELYEDREAPDYRNSIKESISAIESMARIVADKPKATLGDAIKRIDKTKGLHPALKSGLSSIYGYTNDEQGIRHAMLEEPEHITSAEARFFLFSCISFVNYLKAKMPEDG